MRALIVCFRDELVGFDKPQIEVNENSAIRNFAYALTHNDYLTEHAKDYSLWLIGEFDNEKGTILYDDKKTYPIKLVDGSSIVNGIVAKGDSNDKKTK